MFSSSRLREFSLRRLTARDTWEHVASYSTLTQTVNGLRTRHEGTEFDPSLWLVEERDYTGWVRAYRITDDWDAYEVPVGGMLAPHPLGDMIHAEG